MMSGNSIQGTADVRKGLVIPRTLIASMDPSVLDEDNKLWDSFGGKQLCLGDDAAAAQLDRVVHLAGGRELMFANSGFVVNLTDDDDPIPPSHIGLTRSLLFAAVLQAAKAEGEGLIALDTKVGEQIVADTTAALPDGESLLTPGFGDLSAIDAR